jgi:hypothetical protein
LPLIAGGIVLLGFGCGVSERNEVSLGYDPSGGGGMSPGGSGAESSGGAATSGKGGLTTGGTESGTGGRTATGGRTGGKGGWAGTAGYGGAECRSASDCRLLSDCCGCEAEPVDSELGCSLSCDDEDSCALAGIEADEVDCLQGQCVINRSCDRNRITCTDAPPACPFGTAPSVGPENCWGPCIAVTECAWVTDCSDCGDTLCVSYTPGDTSYLCRHPKNGCNRGVYCNCLLECPYDCFERDEVVACVCLEC